MIKKLSLLALAVGALVAFAVPAAASADVRITDANGNALANGTTITGTSLNAKTSTVNGTLTCEHVHVDAEVTTNTAATVLVDGIAVVSKTCSVEQTGTPVVITATMNNIHITTNGTKTATFNFISHIGGVGGPKCEYGGTIPITYTPETNEINVNGTLTGSSSEFPCAGSASFNGDFVLTAEGEPVSLM